MKYSISLFMGALISFNVSASPIKIFFEDSSTRAGWVKDIFVETYKIPEDLITIKKVSKCKDLTEKGKLDLCLNNNGDLLIVSVDSSFVSESLTIFRAP